MLGTYVPQFNGNISGTIWKSKGDGQKRKYDFTYDAVNRLNTASFKQYVSGSGTSAVFDISAGVDFSVSNLTYDANGNIVTMNQNGLKLNTSPAIDQFNYTYQTKSNKLKNVRDAVNDPTTTLGDFKTSTQHPQYAAKANATTQTARDAITDYNYDANGNLTLDYNKDISTITYNHLNLPSVITVTGKGSITYTYDASGNKLKKVTQENGASVPFNGTNYTSNITTTTQYISGFVYETKAYSNVSLVSLQYTDVLQFTAHEEGRIRRKTDGTFVYDYFLKDHLGNVRMVLTEEQQTDIYPVATLETSNLALEQKYYNITSGQIIDKTSVTGLPAYVNHNIIPTNPVNATFDNANSAKVYKLNKNSQNVGLGITLKVMAGDKLDIYGKSYYFQNNTGGTAANTAVTTLQILTGLLGGPTGGAANVHGTVTPTQLNAISGTTALINTLLSSQTATNNPTPLVPKAFINYILFDEQFKCIGSGFAPVGANSVLTDYGTNPALHNIPVTKNGFVYIYCSNESPVDVFFDNLQVMHTRSPILEETHYYPFGLTMAGISDKSAGCLTNKYKYNGKELQSKEFNDGSGLEEYDYGARMFEPQIGRFNTIDPMSTIAETQSPYNYVENNPLAYTDPTGMFKVEVSGDYIKEHKIENLEQFCNTLINFMDNLEQFGKDNPDVIDEISRSTGLEKDKISEDFKSGEGPTFMLGDIPLTESQDTKTRNINISIEPFLNLSKIDKDKNKDDYNIAMFTAMGYGLHEYGHLGDKETNNGHNSGQTDRNAGDLEVSSQQGGPQRPKAITGHRGSDIEHKIIFGNISYLNPIGPININRQIAPYSWNYTITPQQRDAVKNSQRFKKTTFK